MGRREARPGLRTSLSVSGRIGRSGLAAQRGSPGPPALQVAEDTRRQRAREHLVRDALHVVGRDRLDPLEQLVEADLAAEVDLLTGQVAHAAARVLEGEHEAALEVVLGPAQLLPREGLGPGPSEL